MKKCAGHLFAKYSHFLSRPTFVSFGVPVQVTTAVSPNTSVKHFTFPRSSHVLLRNIQYLLIGLPGFLLRYNGISSSFLLTYSHSRSLTGPHRHSVDCLTFCTNLSTFNAALVLSGDSLHFIAGLTTVHKIIPLVITGAFWSHNILASFLHSSSSTPNSPFLG